MVFRSVLCWIVIIMSHSRGSGLHVFRVWWKWVCSSIWCPVLAAWLVYWFGWDMESLCIWYMYRSHVTFWSCHFVGSGLIDLELILESIGAWSHQPGWQKNPGCGSETHVVWISGVRTPLSQLPVAGSYLVHILSYLILSDLIWSDMILSTWFKTKPWIQTNNPRCVNLYSGRRSLKHLIVAGSYLISSYLIW